MNTNEFKKEGVKKSLRAAFIDTLSILHLILLFFGGFLYKILLEPNPGMAFMLGILGAPILAIAGGMAIIIYLKKEKNLFNKISSIFTLSVIGLLLAATILLPIARLFIDN